MKQLKAFIRIIYTVTLVLTITLLLPIDSKTVHAQRLDMKKGEGGSEVQGSAGPSGNYG